jgi:hypothetical protein
MGVLIVLAGLAWVNGMLQKSRHYAGQAAIQARLVTLCSEDEKRLEPGKDGFGSGESSEPQESERHADLQRRYERLAIHPWESPPADLPMPFPWNRDRDRQVIEAALDHLLDPRNPENAIAYPANSGSGLEVVLGQMSYSDHYQGCRSNGEEKGRSAEDEARSDLARRNSGGGLPLDELGTGWRRPIRLDNLERLYEKGVDAGESLWDYFHQRHPSACGWLEVSLPGYSHDGQTAMVRFARPSYHGEFWTYVLNKGEPGWEVRKRDHEIGE